MTRRIDFIAHTSTIPDYFLDSLQDFIQSLAANFQLSIASSSSIQVAAGPGDQVAAISIGGKWRFNTATVNAAHPGGAAGDYDIFVTGSDDDFSGTAPVDQTVYSFGLVILPTGSTPATALKRKVGTLHWEGSTGAGGISGITQLVSGPPPGPMNGDDGTPAMDGVAARGSSLRYARADHVHATDTTRAPLASPALTGSPTAPTPAVDDDDTSIATTAFVIGQASAAGDGTPAMDGAAARGASIHFARADHVHPTDTTRAPLASPAFTGTPAGPTAAVDTNTTQLATTAFVLAQASAAGDGNPAMDGATARGASTHYARADHVHPTDASRAPLASPTLTGTPAGPTAAVDTNTTQLATTAFVLGQASAAGDGNPVMDGAAARGTSTHFARADHVHPVDTSRAPLASPAFTGNPTAPTPVTSDNDTSLATTAFVQAVVAEVAAGAVPTGVMTEFIGSAAPAGWLLCDGAAVSRTTYAALFAVIGTTHGAGDGSTTFNLPDMRGSVPVGKAAAGTFAALGAHVGSETHAVSLAEMPSHDHGGTTAAVSAGTPSGTVTVAASGALVTGGRSAAHTHSGSTGVNGNGHTHGYTAAVFGNIANGSTATGATGTTTLSTGGESANHAHAFTSGTESADHTHTVPTHAHTATFAGSALATHSHTIAAQGGGAAMSLVQPSVVVNYIVKT